MLCEVESEKNEELQMILEAVHFFPNVLSLLSRIFSAILCRITEEMHKVNFFIKSFHHLQQNYRYCNFHLPSKPEFSWMCVVEVCVSGVKVQFSTLKDKIITEFSMSVAGVWPECNMPESLGQRGAVQQQFSAQCEC